MHGGRTMGKYSEAFVAFDVATTPAVSRDPEDAIGKPMSVKNALARA
jgi:hypothetical protein